MMVVNGCAVGEEFAEDRCVAAAGAIEGLQSNHGCAFTERKPVASGVKRPTDGGRERLQRVEAREHHFAQGIIAAGECALALAGTNQVPRLADGVAAGGAGVRNDRDGAGEIERVENHPCLDLRLVINGAGGLAALAMRGLQRLAEISFSERHAARRRAQDQGQVLRGFPAGLAPCFIRGEQEHLAGAVKPGNLPVVQTRRRQRGRQIHFGGDLHALAADIEKSYGPECAVAGAKTLGVRFPADAQSRNHTRSGNDHPRRCCGRRKGKKHGTMNDKARLNQPGMSKSKFRPKSQLAIRCVAAFTAHPFEPVCARHAPSNSVFAIYRMVQGGTE